MGGPFFDKIDRPEHWSTRAARVLSASWLALILCILFAFVLGRLKVAGELSGAVALMSVAVFFHGTLLWLILLLLVAVTRRGKLGKYLWLQTASLVGLELLVGWGIAHQ